MRIFWGEGFLKGLMKLLFLVLLVLFLWGWVVNVPSGRMTTRQYINKIYRDLQRGITTIANEVNARTGRVMHNTKTWYGAYEGPSE